MTWGDTYRRYLSKGHDHGSAAFEADRAERLAALIKGAAARRQARKLEAATEALRKIVAWEMPASGVRWDDGSPMSFGAAYGSQGEREVIRSIAEEALKKIGG